MEQFKEILKQVYNKSQLQKKKIEMHLAQRDDTFFVEAEKSVAEYIGYLKSQNVKLEYAIDAYLSLCSDTMLNNIRFMKTGKYPIDNSADAVENVYSNDTDMKLYMRNIIAKIVINFIV